MNSIITATLNLLAISIPEETFLVAFTLILLERFDLLNFKNKQVLRIIIPIVVSAMLSNVLRYTNANSVIVSVLPPLVMLLLILTTYKISGLKNVSKAVMYIVLSLITFQIIELLYMPLVFYTTDTTVKDFNNNVFYSFLLALPERVIEYSLVAYLIVNKITIRNVNVFKEILKSRLLTAIALVILVCNFSLLVAMAVLVGFNKALSGLNFTTQLLIIIVDLMFPILNMSMFYFCIYYLKGKEQYEKTLDKKRLNLLIDIYANYEDDDKIDGILAEIKKCINEEAVP